VARRRRHRPSAAATDGCRQNRIAISDRHCRRLPGRARGLAFGCRRLGWWLCASAGVAVASLAEGLLPLWSPRRHGRSSWVATILIPACPRRCGMAQTRVRHGERARRLCCGPGAVRDQGPARSVLVSRSRTSSPLSQPPSDPQQRAPVREQFDPADHAALPGGRVRGGGGRPSRRYSPFVSGLITIAAARMMLMLALYLFLRARERIASRGRARRPRLHGDADLLLWSAQFSYESLALPLATVGVFALVRWQSAPDGARAPLDGCARARRKWVLCRRITSPPTRCLPSWPHMPVAFADAPAAGAPLAIAAVTAALAIGWLALAASGTIAYLAPSREHGSRQGPRPRSTARRRRESCLPTRAELSRRPPPSG